MQYEEVVNENAETDKDLEQSGTVATPSTSKTSTSNAHISLSSFTKDPDVKRNTEFFDEFQQIMADSNTSELFIPYISQFQAMYQKAQRSLKKRTETKASTNSQELSEQDNFEVSVEDLLEDRNQSIN